MLLSYDNVRLEGGGVGTIVDELPNVHAVAHARAVLFKPDVGQELVGVVSMVSSSHVGALLCGTFNVTASEDGLAGFAFDAEAEEW